MLSVTQPDTSYCGFSHDAIRRLHEVDGDVDVNRWIQEAVDSKAGADGLFAIASQDWVFSQIAYERAHDEFKLAGDSYIDLTFPGPPAPPET